LEDIGSFGMLNADKHGEVYDLIVDRDWDEVLKEVEDGFPLDVVLLDHDTLPGLVYRKYFSESSRGKFVRPELRNLVLLFLRKLVEGEGLVIKSTSLYGSIFSTDLDNAFIQEVALEGFNNGYRFDDEYDLSIKKIFRSELSIPLKIERLELLLKIYPGTISVESLGKAVPDFFIPSQERSMWEWVTSYQCPEIDGGLFQTQVEFLLSLNANLNAQTKREGHTGVMRAAMTWMPEALDFLVSKGADVNIQSGLGNTALMYVSGYLPDTSPMNEKWVELPEHLQIAKILVEAGADISIKNKSGDTAIDLARKNKNTAVLEFLESL